MKALFHRVAWCAPLLLVLLGAASPAHAQVCSGNRNLNSQAQVDLFDCAVVTGTLNISGFDITDLTPLAELTTVGSTITSEFTISSNDNLVSLVGLENLASVSGPIHIRHNPVLASLSGLDGLTSTDTLLSVLNNDGLTSLMGLEGITNLGGINIQDNPALESLHGLAGLTTVERVFFVANNSTLESLAGLENLTSVGSILGISDNEQLGSLTGLENLVMVGGNLSISQNPLLESLTGLDGLTTAGRLTIAQNSVLVSLDGLENLTAIDESLTIILNPMLVSLHGLEGLDSVAESIQINQNNLLESLDGMEGITSVEALQIMENDVLNHCVCGLGGLISGTPAMFTGVGGSVDIEDNLLLGECTSPAVVLAATCIPVANEPAAISNGGFALSAVWPNPISTTGEFTLESAVTRHVLVAVYDMLGRKVFTLFEGKMSVGAPQHISFDVAELPSGVYVVRAEGTDFSVARRMAVIR